MGAIYRIWNTQNGKSYIGQSYRPYNRILQHLIPHSDEGSREIHNDLHRYPPESWNWEILAYGIDERSCRIVNPPWVGFVHKSINTLERELIRQYDSINNGYNRQPGGGVEYRQTLSESYTPLQMRKKIFDAIYAYRFQRQRGISVEAYRHQRETQLQHEREAQRVPALEAQLQRAQEALHHLEQENQLLREQQHRPEDIQEQGCWTIFLIWCGIAVLSGLLASC